MRNAIWTSLTALLLAGCLTSRHMINTEINPDIQLPDKPRLAVLPFDISGYSSEEDLTVIRQNWRNMVEAGLLRNSFRIIDRDVVDNILREQHFQKSGAIDKTSSVDLGKILGINYVLNGTVRVLTSDGSQFHLELRVVNVQTAELLGTTFATGNAGIGYRAANSLAQKLKSRFNTSDSPLVHR